MRVIGVIPARYKSVRFPGKPLALIKDKPMIRRVYERALLASGLDTVAVATDDEQIAECVRSFSGTVVMTSEKCATGTERIIELAKVLSADIYVNIQGDEPLIEPSLIDSVVKALKTDPKASCATAKRLTSDPAEWSNVNVVKVVTDRDGYALYFSRSPIPYPREKSPGYYKHIGIYAYKSELLSRISDTPRPEMEIAESLEQLRILYMGEKIKVIETQFDSVSVDVPEDINRVESILSKHYE